MRARFFLKIGFLIWVWVSSLAWSEISGSYYTPFQLEEEIARKITAVSEFAAIRTKAESLGIRVWLFGGTAAGFGHYCKWNLELASGSTQLQKHRFDFDYTNIYHSNQDLDLVVDGPEDKALELENWLKENYPQFQGQQSAWEVRLLRQTWREKYALLDDPNFFNQHTDSNSTGLIEITVPPKGESGLRDLYHWDKNNPRFLKDLAQGTIRYYFSPKHASTQRAKDGLNPPIFSVVRYLTKVFQYKLEMTPEDTEVIKAIIRRFDPREDLPTPYAKNWMERNGKKLFQNAVDLEYAWNQLEKLGLRKKLIAVGKDTDTKDTLAWWLNREPLRSFDLGGGKGKTARELGIDAVAHDTEDFPAYESITRSHTGTPNAFVSRENTVGEVAASGWGFYTTLGRVGRGNHRITIRFQVNPKAREGTDFILLEGDVILFRNRNALEVIPESLNLGPIEYFEHIGSRYLEQEGNEGILIKLRRRFENRKRTLSPEEVAQIHQLVEESVASGDPNWIVLREWFALPQHENYADPLRGKGLFHARGKIDSVKYSSNINSRRLVFNGLLGQIYWPRDFVELLELNWDGNLDAEVAQAIPQTQNIHPSPENLAHFVFNVRQQQKVNELSLDILSKFSTAQEILAFLSFRTPIKISQDLSQPPRVNNGGDRPFSSLEFMRKCQQDIHRLFEDTNPTAQEWKTFVEIQPSSEAVVDALAEALAALQALSTGLKNGQSKEDILTLLIWTPRTWGRVHHYKDHLKEWLPILQERGATPADFARLLDNPGISPWDTLEILKAAYPQSLADPGSYVNLIDSLDTTGILDLQFLNALKVLLKRSLSEPRMKHGRKALQTYLAKIEAQISTVKKYGLTQLYGLVPISVSPAKEGASRTNLPSPQEAIPPLFVPLGFSPDSNASCQNSLGDIS